MDQKFEPLFKSLTLPNGQTLKNRFVLAPMTHTLSHEDGTISDIELSYIKTRAEDVGLAITAASYTNVEGKAFPGEPSVSKEADLEGLKTLAQTLQTNGTKAVLQIHHGGAKALPELVPNGDVKGPSEVSTIGFGKSEPHDVREMTVEEIQQAIKDFGYATHLAIEAGFDGIEIHGANHYLIHQFVSPYYNRRSDEWGEPLRFPMAIVDEVLRIVKAEAPEDFIVGYRFSPEEAEDPGITMELTKRLVDELIEKPLDYLHVSLMDIHSETREGEYKGQKRIDLLLKWIDYRMPLIGVGSIFTAQDAVDALDTGVPLVCLGRELLFDPQFIHKIETGHPDDIISYFDKTREDKHDLPDAIWDAFAEGMYPSPKPNK
ncbi:NADH-dependent flavin oxidoreductase [Staphylococcus canis]|uniref:NADH-dependent flavin oxidoreductase n=1 Tax=Staphylococcus canis TaxID=2724942 RepID=A0ABS0TDJ7_9STAP|nr:NADH-dependent flavin oxidoreductase [Staphylococcus canis]MBI5975823.1 NADH-dependent flavin oxidoreductase [Staphylococcus canis]